MPAYQQLRRTSAWPLAAVWLLFAAALASAYPQTRSTTSSGAQAPLVKPDARKAKGAFREGQAAEKQQDWETAYEFYSQAAEYAPKNKNYQLRRANVKAALIQSHVDAAERDAISNRLEDARRELLIAKDLDPTNAVVRDRLSEFLADQPAPPKPVSQFASEPQLNYQKGTQNFDYRGDTRGAYDEVARRFGVEDSFDSDMNSRPVHLVANGVDFPTAMRILGTITGTFWSPVSNRMLFVAQDTPQKRREFAEVAL
ncbi:MAG TPA: hypothetical protein VIY69_12565, partial [Candidatus Acidoferrales bacterium]